MQNLTLRQIRTFECAARLLHFGRVSKELHLTQPAVSLQMRALESAVGLPLFERTGRRLYLTRAGEALLEYSHRMLGLLREMGEEMSALRGAGGGEIRIGVLSTGKYLVPRLLAEFRQQQPAVKISFSFNNREDLIRELVQNNVDLAIMGGAPQGIDSVAIPFAKHPLAIVAAPDHPLAGKCRMPLNRLTGETFLIRERGSGTRATMERLFAQSGFVPTETIEISSNETIKQAVMAGMGVSFLSLHTMGLEINTGRIVMLRVRETPLVRQWNIVHRKDKRLSPAAAEFKAFLLRQGAALIHRTTTIPTHRNINKNK